MCIQRFNITVWDTFRFDSSNIDLTIEWFNSSKLMQQDVMEIDLVFLA